MKLLRNLRTNNNKLQKDIAEQLGIDRTTYVKYENGVSEPSFEMLLKLRELFHVSIDYMISCDNEWEYDEYEDFENAKTDYTKMMLIYRYGLPSNYTDVAKFYFEQLHLVFNSTMHAGTDAELAFAIQKLSEEQKEHLLSYTSLLDGIVSKYDKLNDIGKERANEYIDGLLINEMFAKKDKKELVNPNDKVYYVGQEDDTTYIAAYGGGTDDDDDTVYHT